MSPLERFRPAGLGRVRMGLTQTWWSAGGVAVQEAPERAPEPVAYSMDPAPPSRPSTTRPACACKFFGLTGLGQGGCATPIEGAPATAEGSMPADAPPSKAAPEGPSTIAIVGGVGVLGVLGLLAAGVI